MGYDAGLNLYAYASNDPVNYTDPSGMDEACDIPGGTVIVNGVTTELTGSCGTRLPPNLTGLGPLLGGSSPPTTPQVTESVTVTATRTGTNQKPTTRKTPKQCLVEAQEETGVDILADVGLAALSFSPVGAGAKIGLAAGLAAVPIMYDLAHKNAEGPILANFGFQLAAVDAGAAAQAGWRYGERFVSAARLVSGVAVLHDLSNYYQKYNACMAGH